MYVTSNKTFGNSDENYVFYSENISPYSTKGTFEEWQTLSQLIEPHNLAVFAFSCAFTGQLLEPLNEESGGFHNYGNSTDGKSTLAKASCSVWGSPFDGQNKYPNAWRTTDNALENNAELRNDSYMVLDELKQATAKTVSNVTYMLANNDGKERMKRSAKNQVKKTWNILFLSTGEITLSEHLRRDNLTLDAGQELRFAHIPSDQNHGFGVFDTIDGFDSAQHLADKIKSMASRNYGYAGTKWLEYVTKSKSTLITQAQSIIERFLNEFANGLSNQVARVAKRFAMVASAGELATQAQITKWRSGRSYEAVGQCFQSWYREFGTADNLEEQKILKHIKLFFECHGSSRFESLEVKRNAIGEEIKPCIHNRVGYYDEDKKMYLISNAMFESEICKGFNVSKVIQILKNQGWILYEKGRHTKKASKSLPDGTRPYLFHFSSVAMQNINNELADTVIFNETSETSETKVCNSLKVKDKNHVSPKSLEQIPTETYHLNHAT